MTELNTDFSSLGQWLKKDIVNSFSNDNNKSIIMQPLSGCCNLYPSKKNNEFKSNQIPQMAKF